VISKIKSDDPRLKDLLNFEKSRDFAFSHTEFSRLAKMGEIWGLIENEELLAAVIITKQMKTNTIAAMAVHKDKRAAKIGTELLREMFNKYPDKLMLGQIRESNVGARRMATGLGCIEGPAKNGLINLTRPSQSDTGKRSGS
jgi:hypothetical protein